MQRVHTRGIVIGMLTAMWLGISPLDAQTVSVTPDGGTSSAPGVSSGNSVTFTVTNTGATQYFSFSCARTNQVTACTPPAPIQINGGQAANVNVTYSTGTQGIGTITLTAFGMDLWPIAEDNGSFTITVTAPIPPTNWNVTWYNHTHQDLARCAASCFAAVYAHSTVPYFSLDTPRNVTLIYNSDQQTVKPIVQFDVVKPAGATPQKVWLQVKRSGVLQTFANGETTLKFTGSASMQRIAGLLTASALTSGMHDVEVIVTWDYGGSTTVQSWLTKLMVLNEQASSIAAGWTWAGVQRLYNTANSGALVTEGDGSGVYFPQIATGYASPSGEFSVLKTLGGGWQRLYPDSTDIRFDSSGRMTDVYDPYNNRTQFHWGGDFALDSITDPNSKRIKFTYGTYGLATIKDVNNRTTTVTVNSSKRLTQIKDPDNKATDFTYTTGGL